MSEKNNVRKASPYTSYYLTCDTIVVKPERTWHHKAMAAKMRYSWTSVGNKTTVTKLPLVWTHFKNVTNTLKVRCNKRFSRPCIPLYASLDVKTLTSLIYSSNREQITLTSFLFDHCAVCISFTNHQTALSVPPFRCQKIGLHRLLGHLFSFLNNENATSCVTSHTKQGCLVEMQQ